MNKKDKLYLAIKRAKGHGKCCYEINGEPCCIIGHLAIIEGLSINTLKKWDNESATSFSAVSANNKRGTKTLSNKYGSSFLCRLQLMWDLVGDSTAESRKKMRKLVEKEYGAES